MGTDTPASKIKDEQGRIVKISDITSETTESILSEASRILSGDRQADYGDPVENFNNIAKEASLWCGKELSALDCVNVMIAVKTCRERFKPKRDNRVDLVAYQMIRDEILKEMKNGK